MNSIETSPVALQAADSLRAATRLHGQLIHQMATGRRISSAMDDSAGLNTAQVMTSQLMGIQMALHDLKDGVSLAQTAEGALSTISDALIRMRELAVQAATGTLSDNQRSNLDLEFQDHKQLILDVVQKTQWNGYRLFKELTSTSFQIQVGPDAGDQITINIPQIYAGGQLIAFQNGDFETGTVGSSSISGWTTGLGRVTLDGNSQIGSWPTPIDSTKPASSPGDTVALQTSGTFSAKLVASDGAARGTKSLQLESTGGMRVVSPFGITHGPYIISNNSVSIAAGESVSFDWKAQGGDDSYDVYAYLLDVDNGSTVKLLDSTGSSTNWATVTTTVPSAGNYKFVFVSGSFDASGGQALGARLFVDNIQAPPTASPTLNSTDINSMSSAAAAIAEVDLNIGSVHSARAALGASLNRMEHIADHLSQYAHKIASSRSKIEDAEYSVLTAALAQTHIVKTSAEFVLQQSRTNQQLSVDMVQTGGNFANSLINR